jgi:hypothetical protein
MSAPPIDQRHDVPPADSDESLRHFADRIFTVQGALGLGTIVGNVGVLGVLTPHERVSLVAATTSAASIRRAGLSSTWDTRCARET